MAESWKKPKLSNVFSLFIMCYNRNRPALVHKLLSNNSLCVGQLYEDKALALHALDLIYFITDLQTELLFNNLIWVKTVYKSHY